MMTTSTPSTCQPARQPNSSTMAVSGGAITMPPIEKPTAAAPMARPRRSTNHLESVTLTTRLPIIAEPAMNSRPRSTSHCHHSSMCPIANIVEATRTPPTSITPRPPRRSTWAPMKKPIAPVTNWPTVWASVNSVRDQPRSSVIGTRKTPPA